MMVVPEGGSLFPHNMTMVVDGHTGVEHSVPDRAASTTTSCSSGARRKVGYTPTLIVAYGGLVGENYWYEQDPRLGRRAAADVRAAPDRSTRARAGRMTAPDDECNHFNVAEEAAKLHRAGVGVQLGAHGQREGLGAHWEMWMLAQGGMTPLEALRCATLGGARYLGFDKDIGSLEPGKLADLIVLDAQSAGGHPQHRERVARHAERPALRRRDPGRARAAPAGARAVWWEAEQREQAAVTR